MENRGRERMWNKIFNRKESSLATVKIKRPFKEFLKTEEFSGIILMICIVLALIIANSFLSHSYFELSELEIGITLGDFSFSKPLHYWINDGLMTLFFFVVGLEIKREILVGELKSLKKALLPISAAIGGMIVPVIFYSLVNINNPSGGRGWGIAMATDIAFVIGTLALLGPRVPFALKIFLTSLAIVDDIGAIVVIALFYTREIGMVFLIFASFILVGLFLINRLGVQNHYMYGLMGILLWYCVFLSGLHATLAGILVAISIPTKTKINPDDFVNESQLIIEKFKLAGQRDKEILLNRQHLAAIKTLELSVLNVQTPLQRFERGLHYWVGLLIIPLFIFVNSGIALESVELSMIFEPITLGIIVGLVFGKQIGIFVFSYVAVKSGLAEKPSGVTWAHIYGASWLGGIGYTMSIFIASLALINPESLIKAKIGIILGSLIAGIIGYGILRYISMKSQKAYLNSKEI